MKTKLTINELRIKSFITSINNGKGDKVKGGGCWWPTMTDITSVSSQHHEP